jgi:hypothetical protein
MPNSNYLTEEEKQKRQQQQQAQMSPNNPAMALNGNYMRQSASDVVNSWATPTPTTGATGTTPEAKKPTLSEQAINNYTNKVQSLYDYEAQQRAQADANFQKSMRYLPQMFKQAGLYGSGQSESTLADMANQQRNTQNAISAETNKGIMDLKEHYNADVENLDEQTKLQVDEVANYISQRDWSNASKGDWDNFINYIKSADYSDDVINKAISQIKAFNPDVGNRIDMMTFNKTSDSSNISQLDINKSKQFTENNTSNKIRYETDFYTTFNGVRYRLRATKVVSNSMDKTLDDFASIAGIENKAGTVIYYQGKLYVQSGQDKGWRNVTYTNYKNTQWTKESYDRLIKSLS